MNKDFELSYRSLFRPDPLCIESALYGGYQYIELSEDVWINRVYEYLVRGAYSTNQNLRRLALQELQNLKEDHKFIYPSTIQKSNYAKMYKTLVGVKNFAVHTYSTALETMFASMPYTTIFSDSPYHIPNVTLVTEAELYELSDHMLCIFPYDSNISKIDIKNWGNIIICGPDALYNENGGLYVTSTDKYPEIE